MSTQLPEHDADATFHEVVFGESGTEQLRYGFEDFRALSLRARVKLLMSMPAVFRSAAGEEIPRDVAMRFRQGTGGPAPTGVSAVPEGDERTVRLLRTLLESTLEHELRGNIKIAESIELDNVEQRAVLATGLLRAAKLLEQDHGSTPASWAAIRRFGTLVPTARLAELLVFLQTGTEVETMQAALQTLWHALSVDQDHGLAVVAVRVRQLLTKFLDPDWLCSSTTRALTVDLLLAYGVLVPSAEEASLRKLFARLRPLADGVVLELARADIDAALTHARAHGRPTLARLQLLAELAG